MVVSPFDWGSVGSNLGDTFGNIGLGTGVDPGATGGLGTGGFTFTDPNTGLPVNVDPSTGGSFDLGNQGGVPVTDIAGGSQNTNVLPVGAGSGLGVSGPTTAQPGGTGTLGGPTSGGTTRGSPGLFTDANGNLNLASLLSMLGPLLSGAYTANKTSTATNQMLNAIQNANQQITQNLGGNAALFQPYRNVGQQGLNQLAALPQSHLAGAFPALGTPASQMPPGFSLGALARR